MKTLPTQQLRSKSRQQGFGTLLVSVVFLFLATILIITVSRSALIDQKMSSNEIRHKQAFEAAQAGLERAMVYLATTAISPSLVPPGADKNGDNIADTLTETLSNGSQYKVGFCNPTNLPAQGRQLCPDAPSGAINCVDPLDNNPTSESRYLNTPLVVSCGWSDDVLAKHLVRQLVGTVSPISAPPTNPLTAKGAMNVSGSANVVNYFNNLTIWTGGALSTIGNAGKTFVRNPAVAPPSDTAAPPGEPSSCTTTADYVCLTDKNTTGPDVIERDPTLANLSDDQMFLNYFGRTLTAVKSDSATMQVPAADLASLSGITGATIVVNGTTTIPAGSTYGSRDRPVVMIIDGNVEFSGNPTVFGIVYVTGDVDGGGTPTIQGAMVIEGDIAPTGSVDIIYDPYITSGTSNSGKPGPVPGSWRDWR